MRTKGSRDRPVGATPITTIVISNSGMNVLVLQ